MIGFDQVVDSGKQYHLLMMEVGTRLNL